MPYSVFTILALTIHIIVNIDIFLMGKPPKSLVAIKEYKAFVISIALFFLTDVLWGVFEENKLAIALYIDTTAYFLMMGSTIFFWTRYVTKLLGGRKVFSQIVRWVGFTFLLTEVVLLIVNIPLPVLFRVDLSTCVYESYIARNVMLWIQIGMYLLAFIFTLVNTIINKERKHLVRNIAIIAYSLINATFIFIQLFDPYLPLYSMGLLIGICVLSIFVVRDIREAYRDALLESKNNEKIQKEELGNAITQARTDSLTGTKNKYAYIELEEEMDRLIAEDKAEDFAIVVCDLNGLKTINDKYGHDKGDQYIIASVKVIEEYFGKEEIYRFGGDEFVVFLKGELYKQRRTILNNFNRFIDGCLGKDLPVISAGMSAYKRGEDNTFRAVFNRADKSMYSRKEMLKEHL